MRRLQARSERWRSWRSTFRRGISNIGGSRNYFRRGSQLQTIASAILSATATLLIALNQIYHQSILIALSLVAGAFTTITVTWASWFNFHRRWLADAATLTKLWALRDQIEYDKAVHGGRLTHDHVNRYHKRFLEIFAEHNQAWQRIRAEEEK